MLSVLDMRLSNPCPPMPVAKISFRFMAISSTATTPSCRIEVWIFQSSVPRIQFWTFGVMSQTWLCQKQTEQEKQPLHFSRLPQLFSFLVGRLGGYSSKFHGEHMLEAAPLPSVAPGKGCSSGPAHASVDRPATLALDHGLSAPCALV